jgi:putative membrane protein
MMWFGGPWIWGRPGFGGGIMMLFGIIVFIVGIVFIFRWLTFMPRHINEFHKSSIENSEALEILKIRFARGEITSEEYERMKKELGF